MKNTRQLIPLLASALCVMVNPAQGDVFNYSYTFGDGVVASGSLSGTANGLFVDNVSNVSLFFGTTEVLGIFASQYDPVTPGYLSGPVVSFDVTKNNFVFSNSDLANSDYSYDSSFSIINYPSFSDATAFSTTQGIGSNHAPPVQATLGAVPPVGWSLVQVPDQVATGALLALAILTMALWRRIT